jgi:uncharacterized protein YkwD
LVVSRATHVLVCFAIGFGSFVLAPAAGAGVRTTAVASLLQAVNQTRSSYGLRPLQIDVRLARAAKAHSVEMIRGNYFSHGDFQSRMNAFHVQGPAMGENLAWGNGSYAQASTMVSEWLASPSHRANLLHPGWTRIGIGLVRGTFLGNGGSTVVTADFAGR